jgi:pimeloyl-ACP methyl ester carboxylesterase
MVFITSRSVRWQLSSLHPARAQVVRNHAVDLGLLEDASFVTSDGLTLRGWYHPSSNRAAIVLGHGWGGSRETLLLEGKMLARHGYGVLLFDWRAHGESDGDTCTWGGLEQRDLRAALDYVATRPDVDPARIGVVGFSMGGDVAIDVAAADPRIKALVIEGATGTYAEEVRENAGRFRAFTAPAALWFLRREVDVDAVRPLDHVCAIGQRPMLFITGDYTHKDQPEHLARELFDAACSTKKEYLNVPGAGHGEYAATAPAEIERRMVALFQSALQPTTPLVDH